MRKRIGITLTLDKRNKIYTTPHTSTNSEMCREFFWKNLTGLFITPRLTNGCSPPMVEEQWGREATSCTYTHIFWQCPKMYSFWEDIGSTINSIFSLCIPKPFCVQYLGDIPDEVEKTDRCLFKILQISSGTKRIHLLYEKERMVSNTNKCQRNRKTHICTMTAKSNIWEQMEKAE